MKEFLINTGLLDLTPAIGLFILSIMFITLISAATKLILNTPGLKDPIPTSHKIAVIGLPAAGKTTLITAIFELIQRSTSLEGVRLHGLSTIKTVNQYIAHLNSGLQIGPTTENETFIFRFSYNKRRGLLARLYDVEIADFPGEYSGRISSETNLASAEQESSTRRRGKRTEKQHSVEPHENELTPDSEFDFTLFNREFFSWIASSREYLFVIDLASIYSGDYSRGKIADITARIRTSWQVIEDAASERGLGNVRHRSVHIVFTKVDSLIPAIRAERTLFDLLETLANDDSDLSIHLRELKKNIITQGSIHDLSRSDTISIDELSKLRDENNANFLDLIEFFKTRARVADVFYCSMRIVGEGRERMGVRGIFNAILP